MDVILIAAFTKPFTFATYFDDRGLGGAEACVLFVAEELARQGFKVRLFNNIERPIRERGVEFFPISSITGREICDLLIVNRRYHPVASFIQARKRVMWIHNLRGAEWFARIGSRFDKLICVSEYHKSALVGLGCPRSSLEVIPNGICYRDYIETHVVKSPHQIIYCSVPERGLDQVYPIFRQLKSVFQDSTLIVTSGKSLWEDAIADEPRDWESCDGVRYLGKVRRQTLIDEQLRSSVMLYPCHGQENFCISAVECMAAGAVPVVSSSSALPYTVGEAGVVISGNVKESKCHDQFIEAIRSLFSDSARTEKMRQLGIERASEFAWNRVIAQGWNPFFEKLMCE